MQVEQIAAIIGLLGGIPTFLALVRLLGWSATPSRNKPNRLRSNLLLERILWIPFLLFCADDLPGM